MFAKVELRTEVYANLFAAAPIAQHLFGQIVSQPSNENRYDLRRRIFDQFSDSWLCRQIGIRIWTFIARAFRMKPNHIAATVSAKLSQESKGIFVEGALFDDRVLTGSEKRRIHRPPTHHEIHEESQDGIVKEAPANRKKKLLAPGRMAEECRGHDVHVKKRTMISGDQDRPVPRDGLNVFQAVDLHEVVGGEMYPARAEDFLAPSPKSFPRAPVHAMDETEGRPFERR